jgi:hypothetical protein
MGAIQKPSASSTALAAESILEDKFERAANNFVIYSAAARKQIV